MKNNIQYLNYCIDMALEYSLAPKRKTFEYIILTKFYKSECKRIRMLTN